MTDLAQRVAALEEHNAQHCKACLQQAAAERQQEHHQAAAAEQAERQRLHELRKPATVRIDSERSFRTQQHKDPLTGARTTFVIDKHRGPLSVTMPLSEWRHLLDYNHEVAAAFEAGHLTVSEV